MSDYPYARVILKHPAFPQRKEVGNVREQMADAKDPITNNLSAQAADPSRLASLLLVAYHTYAPRRALRAGRLDALNWTPYL
jgi:hypothetical protein